MKCPMLTMYAMTYKEPKEYKDRDCLKEECAWWRKDWKCCSMVALTMLLGVLADNLEGILIKMPTPPAINR